MKKNMLIILSLLLMLCACGGESADKKASQMLTEARLALKYGHYSAAKDSILSMRSQYPTAISARRQAILLLDSIEMAAAADSLKIAEGEEWERLHVKQQFFERKLQEDKKKDAE